MARQSSAMFGQSWTEVSVLGSKGFAQAFVEICGNVFSKSQHIYFGYRRKEVAPGTVIWLYSPIFEVHSISVAQGDQSTIRELT